ncbi:MAG: TAXI family TRAP transporter solute-binding subunit [Arenicella sp.]
MKAIKLKFLVAGITAGSILLSGIVQAEQTLTFRIGTGGAGGTYYPVGSTIATAISEPEETKSCDQVAMCGVRGVTATALVTKASVQNVTEVQAGLMESGIVDAATLHFAYKGIKKFKNDKKEDIRVIANLYPEDLHLVLPKGSKIKGLADLYGKRVGIAQAGSGTQSSVELILASYGIDRSNIEEFELNQTETAKLMAAGKLDAYFYAAGTPVSTISKLAEDSGVELYSFSDEEVRQANKAVPYYIPSTIKAGVYPGVDYDVKTLAVSAMLVTHTNQPEDLIYNIVRTMWGERSRFLFDNGHRKAKVITLDSALNGLDGIGVPLHPGAEKFYKRACLFTVPRSENTLQRFPIVCGR